MPPAASEVWASDFGRLPSGEHVDAGLGEFDGGAQARSAGADHEDGRGDLAF